MPITNVKVIEHSKSFEGPELVSIELHYPRAIHSEMLRHGLHHGRSVSSSRAIPTRLLIEQVQDDPVIPEVFYKNEPGMSSWEPLEPKEQEAARTIWLQAAQQAVNSVKLLNDAKAHKQHINRLLEPFIQVHELITATSWINFFDLRTDRTAHPDIIDLALKIKNAIDKSKFKLLREGQWHRPYLAPYLDILDPTEHNIISVALCARLSYATYSNEDKLANSLDVLGSHKWITNQVDLASKLLEHRHMTPFEHVCRPLCRTNGEVPWCDHLYGWQTLRNKLRGWKDKC